MGGKFSMKDRDILRFKLMTSGLELRDDNGIYRKGKMIGRDVEVLEGEDPDAIMFRFDVIRDVSPKIKKEYNLKPAGYPKDIKAEVDCLLERSINRASKKG